tara:strand:- start:23068 stop:23553 length:486 start_codon:yes stop_codon:yes gene_type:complete
MKITKNTIIIALILMNVAVVAFFLLMKPDHPIPPRGPKEIVVEKLDLNKDQRKKFEGLVQEHRSEMKQLHEEIRGAKKSMYRRALDFPKQEDSLLEDLSEKLIAVDKHNIMHLRKVKKMLKKDQLPAFNKMVDNIDRIFHPRPPKPRQEGPGRPPRPPHNN